jgi:uncharacterized damage-inducible protein DinB
MNLMKTFLSVLAVVLYVSISAYSQSLTQADRDRALKYLESTKQGVLDATAGLSEAQWNFKAGPDRWSIAEVTEHIATAEGFLREMIIEKVMIAPPRPDGDNVEAIDAMVITMVPDRTQHRQAPEPLKPANHYGSPQASLKAFTDSRAQTEDFLNTHDDLRAHAIDSPLGKKLDAYEWVLFIAAHSERHTKQILEVKAHPNFPKK